MANPGGPGGPAGWVTVERRLRDGTYAVMPEGATSFLDRWEGVTRAELSLDDAALWPAAFARLRGDGPGVDQQRAAAALTALGYDVPADQLAARWPAGVEVLDAAATAAWFTGLGFGAALLVDAPPPPHLRHYPFYWNSLRMGGRPPDDVGRPIALADTLAALALPPAAPPDAATTAALDALAQAHPLRVPPGLRALWATPGALAAIGDSHPNAPSPRAAADWVVRAAPAITRRPHAVEIMDPHQGEHVWLAVFGDADDDAEIWIELAPHLTPWRCAPTSALFFWDLAQTGDAWRELRSAR